MLDVEDGTKNAYVPFKKYLEKDVKKACDMAHAFETKLIRGFSFYHPKGTDPRKHLPQVVDQLGQISEMCLRSDLTYGVELEANLVGQNGEILAEIHRDRSIRLAPVGYDDALEMIGEIASLKALAGYRGRPRGDLEGLARAMHPHLERTHGGSKQVSHLFVRPAFDVLHHKGFPK